MFVNIQNCSSFFSATADQTTIVSAMRQLENYVAISNVRCVQFRPRKTNDTYFIRIVNGSGCSSPVSLSPRFSSSFIKMNIFPGWTEYRC